MTNRTFTCSVCGETFANGWTDAEALAEAEAAYPGMELATDQPVCDECQKVFLAWLKTADYAVWLQATKPPPRTH